MNLGSAKALPFFLEPAAWRNTWSTFRNSPRSLSDLDLIKREWQEADAEFVDNELRTGEVSLTRDSRIINALGDFAIKATANERSFQVIFQGPRADAFRDGLDDHITRQYEDHLDRFGFEDAESFRFTARIEGYWKRRKWKDSRGRWHIGLDLIAKRWWYQPEGLAPIEEGNVPL